VFGTESRAALRPHGTALCRAKYPYVYQSGTIYTPTLARILNVTPSPHDITVALPLQANPVSSLSKDWY
jgi:hypothetical protein